jgi:hypothetical protein
MVMIVDALLGLAIVSTLPVQLIKRYPLAAIATRLTAVPSS